MAGTIVPASPLITRLEGQSLGYNGTSLSNFDDSNEPQIIGNLEIAGSIASFASLESITGWAALSNGTVYIKVVPDTTAGTCTAEFTATAPTWDNAKMGWYGTGANANHRYLFKLTKGGASLWSDKRYLPKGSSENTYVENDLTIGGKISGNVVADGQLVSDLTPYNSGGFTNEATIFNAISPWVPNVGDRCGVWGRIKLSPTGNVTTVYAIQRVSSTQITMWVVDAPTATLYTINSFGGTTYESIDLLPGTRF